MAHERCSVCSEPTTIDANGRRTHVHGDVYCGTGDGSVASVTTDWTCWRNPNHPVVRHPIYGWPQCQHCHAAPQYYERGEWLPADLTLRLYVPRLTALGIAPGSGVVGLPVMSDLVNIYYEGWIHGQHRSDKWTRRGRWESGVFHAADRMVTAYPTVAHKMVRHVDVHQIGTYNPSTGAITITDETALTDWLETGET